MSIKPKKVGNIYPSGGQAGDVFDPAYIAPCLPGFGAGGGGKELKILNCGGDDKMINGVRIRKLTPTECYKLMGFTAEDCKKASEGGISNTQLYKQAGNSIVVNVLEAIFSELGKTYDEFRSVG